MRFHRVIFLLCILTIGIFFIKEAPVLAQTEADAAIISLSGSGFDIAHAVAFSQDGKYLAVGGTSGIYLIDAQKLSTTDFIATGSWARSVSFFPDSKSLAAGLYDKTIKIWSVPQIRLLQTFVRHQGWVRSISISRDGTLMASGSDDNTVRVWKVSDGKAVLILDKHTTGVRAVALSPDGKLVAAALGDKSMRVWQVADGKLLFTLTGHEDWVRCLAFSLDGKLLASGSFDKTVRIWDVSAGKLLQTLQGHTSSVLGVAFSPDGGTLASGSADTTVRLWRVTDGTSIDVLHGHSDFVYAVVFSPDGKTLASGGGDNTVRLWNLAELKDSDSAAGSGDNTKAQNTDGDHTVSSDCRLCHHPRGLVAPARIIDLRCEGCHASGVSLGWCPGFERSPEAVTSPISYTPYTQPSGIPITSNKTAVVITSPSNGEVLYTQSLNVVPVMVNGRVFSSDGIFSDFTIHLEIWNNTEKTAELTTHPLSNGTFVFQMVVNPEGTIPILVKPSSPDCTYCHEDYRSDGFLPLGDVHIVITATAPDGSYATDERWLKVDISHNIQVPVKVIDAITQQPLAGIPVHAGTVLYEWRARYGAATTQQNGVAQLTLEMLSQAPTVYNLSVPPMILDGRLYATDEPVQLTLSPGMTTNSTITLAVHAQTGQLDGKFIGTDQPIALNGVKLWALQLPAGPAYLTNLDSQGAFTFGNLPVAEYLLVPDSLALIKQGLDVQPQNVDLIGSPQQSVSVKGSEVSPMSGKVNAEGESLLPFAWIRVGDGGPVYAIDPTSDEFMIPNLPSGVSFVTVSAPGYYSLVQRISPANSRLDFQLIPRPEMRRIQWGEGQVFLPPETKGTVNGLELDLDAGWIWGQGGVATQPLLINLSGVRIKITSGQFALEKPAEGMGWLYVYQGQAEVLTGSQGSAKVEDGQMIALVKDAGPLPLESSLALALHPMQTESPVSEISEPSLKARLQSWFVKAGIGIVQIVTFITYFLSLVALIAIPVIVLSSYKAKRRNPLDLKEK